MFPDSNRFARIAQRMLHFEVRIFARDSFTTHTIHDNDQ
jgi:hypothetical protein